MFTLGVGDLDSNIAPSVVIYTALLLHGDPQGTTQLTFFLATLLVGM